MKSYQILPSVFSILSLTAAQTPAGFSPAVTKNLNVTFINNVVLPPGELIPRADTINAPNVSYAGLSASSVILVVDLDVPGANATAPRQTLLHWFAPNVTSTVDAKNTTSTFKIPSPQGGAPYLQPSPPVGDIPHRYVVLLFAQPKNFTVPAAFASINPPANSTARIGFNVTNFIKLTGLSAPLAANYFTVQNLTANVTTTTATAGATTSAKVTTTAAAGATTSAKVTTTVSTNATKTATAAPLQVTKNAGVILERGSTVSFVVGALWIVAQL